ncbi:MAG: hypothetical protein MK135_00355 [Polyangiaceae bacterium]|nr:hypothetical protein [Polyangiaceae bacterium]
MTAGIRVANSITLGAGSCVGRSLKEPGLYVTQTLRHLPRGLDELMKSQEQPQLIETCPVLLKKPKD